jgi:hypothetical protein
MRRLIVAFAIIAVLGAAAWFGGLRIFVIQPIGAVPEGATLIIIGPPKLAFIDSADAICDRSQGGVSLLCRGAMTAGVLNNSTLLLKLPFWQPLYDLTGAPQVNR